ncbi:hypothetical protein [Methylocystis rosea]|uniref:hypothetical protein n=1 Tax=Methylocystis rosea TaxID=173366 RepID=UPI001FE11A15|nr:hypothetical protein [Methylocystis rosea]
MTREIGEMRVDAFDVFDNLNLVALLQKADEATNAAEIRRCFKLARSVTTASTAMPRETFDDRFIDATQRDAALVEPRRKVTRGALVDLQRS